MLYLVSMLDRGIISLLIPSLKRDLHLSDFEIGLLHGPAFALFFCLMGLPLGYIVDRFPRRPFIVGCVLLWGTATLFCGFAQRFIHLIVARAMLGAGEAILSPAAYAILPSVFPPRRTGLVLAVFGTGATFGNAVAFGLGGLILANIPGGGMTLMGMHFAAWQLVFICVAIPALLAAPLALTIADPAPVRASSDTASAHGIGFRQFVKTRALFLTCLFLGYGFLCMGAYAWLSWLPTYLNRLHDMPMQIVGPRIALFALIAVPLGQIGTGMATDRLFSKGWTDAPFIVFGGVALGMLGGAYLALFGDSSLTLWIGATIVFLCFGFSPLATAISLATPPHLRGRISAIFLLVSNLIGVALGPMLVGLINNFYFADESRLGASMAITIGLGTILSAVALLGGRGALRRTAQMNTPSMQ
nr:MFS transporter [Sphingobium sp. JAI105]